MHRLGLLILVAALLSCGYRPTAGRVAYGVDRSRKFAPFLVRNDTPELALTHVVMEASRLELGRQGILAAETDIDTLQVTLRIRSFGETPASFSPAGEVIEYYGEMSLAYAVYAEAVTGVPIAQGSERITYRYDFRPNPQNVRIYRYGAIAQAVRTWVPVLVWQTAAGLRFPPPVPAAPGSVTAAAEAPRPITGPAGGESAVPSEPTEAAP